MALDTISECFSKKDIPNNNQELASAYALISGQNMLKGRRQQQHRLAESDIDIVSLFQQKGSLEDLKTASITLATLNLLENILRHGIKAASDEHYNDVIAERQMLTYKPFVREHIIRKHNG